ncbi:unnamed protein product [Rotaria sp. Silwood2]|nr:unnamed protein product [Rotaria sp. Silwood2]CAF3099298.1 unnamed protein product [Rotaria sp. Silwood2]CAF4457430.1 unnamed protein product [Rotaria sp. Silwood2]
MANFEYLPNELILKCFSYLDFYNLYEIFFCLNQRFKQLILYQTRVQIDLCLVPHEKLPTFCCHLNQLITTNQNYAPSLVADDKYKLNLIFENDLFKETFSKLKSLTLSNIRVKTVYNIVFDETIKIYEKLERLCLRRKITEEPGGSNYTDLLCCNLISSKMKLLKHLQLNFEPYTYQCTDSINRDDDYVNLIFYQLIIGDKSLSDIETLIIGSIPWHRNCGYVTHTRIRFNILSEKLLLCLPKLKYLIVNEVHLEKDHYAKQNRILASTTETNSNIPLNLEVIKIWIDWRYYGLDTRIAMTRFLQNFFMNNNSLDTTTIKRFYINKRNALKPVDLMNFFT